MSPLPRNAISTCVWLAFAACTSTPTSTSHPPRPRASAIESSPVVKSAAAPATSTSEPIAPSASAAPVPIPPPEDPTLALKRQLAPKPDTSILLFGVHRENIEGYAPMFSSEGKPRTDTRPGYTTLVIRTQNGTAEVLGTLPYIALPQGDHFVYLGESSVSVHLPNSPSVTMYDGSPMPRDYDATDVWQTENRKNIPQTMEALARKLKKKLAWGAENTSQIVFVTPKVLCKINTESQVTGGALYFRATTTYSAESMDATPLENNFAKHVSESDLIRFASALFEIPLEDVDLDKPFKETFMTYSFRDDIQLCFDHVNGSTQLMGSILRAGNSARYFSVEKAFGPAPERFAPGNDTLPFDTIKMIFPNAIDAFASRAHDTIFVVQPSTTKELELVVWNVAEQKQSATIAMPGRPVMAESAMGESSRAWENELRPALQDKPRGHGK